MTMAEKHPYISGGGPISKTIQQFRSTLPPTIEASVLKKLNLAPKNESYLINILQFIGVIGEDGTPTAEARTAFTQHDDSEFAKKFSDLVRKAYKDLFSLHGDKAWALEQSSLITYFRQTDQTSDLIGTRQATTFQTLAALGGHGEMRTSRLSASRKEKKERVSTRPKKKEISEATADTSISLSSRSEHRDLGLTVRIEINLPISGDQETYDRIFKSIRENLLSG
jgi:hypothetical protein